MQVKAVKVTKRIDDDTEIEEEISVGDVEIVEGSLVTTKVEVVKIEVE